MTTILMASYNGEKYIGKQIESILKQTETDWKLIIQDDCSLDSTYKIARSYAERYPDKVTAVKHDKNSGNAANNFFSILQYAAEGDYTMFSDDDDVWLPEKIEESIKAMRITEDNVGTNKPVLVHTDLKVADENLNIISDSMFRRQNFNAERCKLNNILTQNIVTGCTIMINKPLVEMVLGTKRPEHAVMHDWWLALIASAFGEIGFVSSPTILYRQHSGNAVGAKNARSVSYNFKRLMNFGQTKQSLNAAYLQAQEFLEFFGSKLDEESKNTVEDFISIPKLSKYRKIQMLNKHDFWKSGFYRKCGQLLFI